nr:NAD(P)/FAD-dependent oxidoreductase [Candidatus Njordarchaeota archaeon]
MARKSIIIIGAGLAGLSAGCYAQINGYTSKIFEHRSKPGGVAAWWRRGDYLIDGGIHFLIAHRPGSPIYNVYREIGAVETGRFLDLTTYLRFVDEASEQTVDITADLSRLASDLRRMSPSDSEIVNRIVREAYRLKDSPLLSEMGMGSPVELRHPWDTVKKLWNMRGFFKYLLGEFSKSTAEYSRKMHSPLLRKIFENLFVPESPSWFIILILASVASGQLGLIEGGCLDFVLSIEKRYKALGGDIKYNSTVERILVEDNRAVGVRLADGSEHPADAVISAADGYSTIFKLLGGRYLNWKIMKQYGTWKLCRPTLTISFGVAREFRDDPPLNIFLLKKPFKVGSRWIDGLSLRIFNYSSRFAPRGKTVIQAMIETEWDYWSNLQENRPKYEAEKRRIAKEVIRRLEENYPCLSSQVEITDVATPYTTWRNTLNHRGSPMGWLMTSKTIMTQTPRSLPGLRNFYMAGQWVVAGGGVPTCIFSGRDVVKILCQLDRRVFKTHAP